MFKALVIKVYFLVSGQSLLWEQQKQLQQLHRQMKTLTVPVLQGGGGGGVHRPLSRTQSSPASTSLTLPEKPLSMTAAETSSKPRFTTGQSESVVQKPLIIIVISAKKLIITSVIFLFFTHEKLILEKNV